MNKSYTPGLIKAAISVGFLGLLLSVGVEAAPIQRTINVNGDVTDWTTPTNITTNPGQFSTDGDGTSCPSTDLDTGTPPTCAVLTPSGRDLQRFAYTWDANKLYIYVQRWAPTNNTTDWWFYLDTNNNGRMENLEPVYRVAWRGSNQNTTRTVYSYNAVDNINGDLLVNPVGDGYTMPGGITGGTALVDLTGGTSPPTAMESELLWTDIGLTGPSSVGFHVASSNTANLPGGILDNMDGPGGGALSFPDLSVTKIVSADPVWSGNTFTYTVTITNNGDADATTVSLTDQLPADVNYVSHVASQGTYSTGTDVWTVGDIPYTTPTLSTATLTFTVTAGIVGSDTTATNTANNLVLDQADPDLTNNFASVDVLIHPAPVLTILKSRSVATAKPSELITYSVAITNTGSGVAPNTVVSDILSTYAAFGVDAMAGQPLQFSDAVPCGNASGVTMGGLLYANDRPPTYSYPGAGSGFDPLITAWQLTMTGSMNVGGCFTLQYQEQVN
jgi:uncharacterized repeat protein (TIGR01451 family)